MSDDSLSELFERLFGGIAANAKTYDIRKVDCYKTDTVIVDTCEVYESYNKFETGISHRAYNEGNWIIVEVYDDIVSAKQGHDRWVEMMTQDELPACLVDTSTNNISDFVDSSYGEGWRAFPRDISQDPT